MPGVLWPLFQRNRHLLHDSEFPRVFPEFPDVFSRRFAGGPDDVLHEVITPLVLRVKGRENEGELLFFRKSILLKPYYGKVPLEVFARCRVMRPTSHCPYSCSDYPKWADYLTEIRVAGHRELQTFRLQGEL